MYRQQANRLKTQGYKMKASQKDWGTGRADGCGYRVSAPLGIRNAGRSYNVCGGPVTPSTSSPVEKAFLNRRTRLRHPLLLTPLNPGLGWWGRLPLSGGNRY